VKWINYRGTESTEKTTDGSTPMLRILIALLSSLCSLCLCGLSVFADPPDAKYLLPAGGQRGTTVKFHAGGLCLNKWCSLEMIGRGVEAWPIVKRVDSPWFDGPVLPLPESQRQEDYPRAMGGTVKIATDAPTGDRFVLLRTSQGITGPLRFLIGDLPEVVEDELPGEPIPVAVAAPVTVNGRIFPHEDIDIWSVTLKKGQVLSASVDAARIGSQLEAKIEVRDPAGKVIAEALGSPGCDPHLRATATTHGTYQVHITDARADGGPAFVYRLTLTTDAAPRETGEPESLPVVRESDTPDPVRGNFLTIPAVGVGRIATAGEADRWGFSARKGEAFEIELQAHRRGSPLLGVLAVTDAAGKELAKAEPGASPNIDPAIHFTAPAAGLYFVTVQDRFRSRGGPEFTYRLRVTRPEPGFDLSFATLGFTAVRGQLANLKVTARRHGSFIGPIVLNVEGLPAGVSVAKEVVLQAGQPTIDIPIKADATAKAEPALIRVRGTGMVSLAPFSSMFVPMTRTAKWAEDATVDQVRLAVALPTPFKIAGDYELKLIPRGTVHARHYRIERNGFTGPIEIELADKQARHLQGVTGPTIVVPADKSEFDYPINLPPWMEMGRTCRVCVMGTATVKDADGSEHVVTYSSREQNDQIIAVVEPERLGLRLDRPTVLAEPGKAATVRVSVRRGEGIKGEATLELVVPRGVSGVSGSSHKIPANAEEGTLTLQFAADARGPFPSPVTLLATVLDGGKPVVAERKLELVAIRK
jgi:hypothetical protein